MIVLQEPTITSGHLEAPKPLLHEPLMLSCLCILDHTDQLAIVLQEPTITSGHLEAPKPLWHERQGYQGGGGRGRGGGRGGYNPIDLPPQMGWGHPMANGNGPHWQGTGPQGNGPQWQGYGPPSNGPLAPGAYRMVENSLGRQFHPANQPRNGSANSYAPMRPGYQSQQVASGITSIRFKIQH